MEGDKDAFVNELDLELCPICKTNYIQPEEIMCASCLKERQAQGKDLDDDDEWNAYMNRDDEDDYVSDDEETGDMASISELDDDVLSDDLVDDLDFGFESMLDDEDFDDEEEEEGKKTT